MMSNSTTTWCSFLLLRRVRLETTSKTLSWRQCGGKQQGRRVAFGQSVDLWVRKTVFHHVTSVLYSPPLSLPHHVMQRAFPFFFGRSGLLL